MLLSFRESREATGLGSKGRGRGWQLERVCHQLALNAYSPGFSIRVPGDDCAGWWASRPGWAVACCASSQEHSSCVQGCILWGAESAVVAY